jgi:hypothetical protein
LKNRNSYDQEGVFYAHGNAESHYSQRGNMIGVKSQSFYNNMRKNELIVLSADPNLDAESQRNKDKNKIK